ncbi:protein FD isoform X1 [Amborella trichopoda]|uniref:protein FD isoform X1 n=1 Tax=Amborella trichopoda TaxID=13333 RepID=UPI0009BD7CB6|nr:protein FD isoform X1 [Amborella trichopoda]|eukprot:XP_020524392.1 protein FD isoform X1 [Amborella trichopoda]
MQIASFYPPDSRLRSLGPGSPVHEMWSVEMNKNGAPALSSTSSSSSSTLHSPPRSNRKTMEDVWRDLNLTLLPRDEGPKGFREMILQDFLTTGNDTRRAQQDEIHVERRGGPQNVAATNLSLITGSDLHYLDWLSYKPASAVQEEEQQRPPHVLEPGAAAPFVAPESAAGLGLCKKRLPPDCREEQSVDRRHKRMIKNRESAARSRARKQAHPLAIHIANPSVFLLSTFNCNDNNNNGGIICFHVNLGCAQAYTNELELEVAHLIEENARLRKHQLTFANPTAAFQHGKTKPATLRRSTTAPF